MFHSSKENSAINNPPNRYIIQDTAQKMKFSINDFFSKCDQIRRKLQETHLLEISLMEIFIFCSVKIKYCDRKSSDEELEQKTWSIFV